MPREQAASRSADPELRGLPSNPDAERFVLGSILIDDSRYVQVAGVLSGADFAVEANRRIFERMGELALQGERIDRVTVANALNSRNQLEAVGGLTYVVSLDDGMPQISNIDSYVRIVKEKAIKRRVIFASQRLIGMATMDEESAETIIGTAGRDFLALAGEMPSSGHKTIREIIEEYPGGVNAMFSGDTRQTGILTGYTRLDDLTNGMRPGELIIIAGRPATGKTALALNIAQNVAFADASRRIAIQSLEMSRESLITRLVCTAARVDSQRFRAGALNVDERRLLMAAAERVASTGITIDDTANLNVIEMHARLRRLKVTVGLDLAVVDYLQLMAASGSGKKYENRVQEVTEISRGLKLMAKDLSIPVLVLSQLSRGPENRQGDHRPRLSDLRESGSIEQDADLVAFIFREELYKPDRADLRGMAELIVGKQRNGPIGTAKLVFIGPLTRFENRAMEVEDRDES